MTGKKSIGGNTVQAVLTYPEVMGVCVAFVVSLCLWMVIILGVLLLRPGW